jgi:hypothetical protein
MLPIYRTILLNSMRYFLQAFTSFIQFSPQQEKINKSLVFSVVDVGILIFSALSDNQI